MKDKRKLKLVTFDPKESALPFEEQVVLEGMLSAWSRFRLGSLNHTQDSVDRGVWVVRKFVSFCDRPPWKWTEQNFEDWAYQIGRVEQLAQSTQRQYHATIKKFLQYLVRSPHYIHECNRLFGRTPRQIVTAENSVPHKKEYEGQRPRIELTHGQIDLLFSTLEEEIEIASQNGSKDYHPLQRDKAMFYTMYISAGRASEIRGLNLNSFLPNADFPEFGNYGRILFWGKGSKGSGPKQRIVPVDHPDLPPILEWYVNNIRPRFLRHADPNEDALFLSQRGRRLCKSSINARFSRRLEDAGLGDFGFTPHSLRHTSLTHGRMRTTAEMQRRKAGHTFATTTEGYTHFGDDFLRSELNKVVSTMIDLQDEEDGPSET